jgi:sigma-B regulation protein RsbU (phosphoserine phosphatase)
LTDQADRYEEVNLLYRVAREHAQQLTTLNELSRVLNSSLDLEQILDLILSKALELLSAEAGSLVLVEGAERELVFRVTRGAHPEQVVGRRLPWGTGLTGRVAAEGWPVISNDVRSDPRFFGQVDDAGFVRAMMILPLIHRGAVIGVLTTINKIDGGDFSTRDIELGAAFADHAAIAIENARLHQAALEKERMDHELHLARDVQTRLVPRGTPTLAGWDFAADWQPAREVSGDFFDFIPRAGGLGLAIADVSDKGMHAALLMALSRSTVRASVAGAASPADALTQANRLLCQDMTGGMFVTLFYAQIDLESDTLTYVNGGHNPALFYSVAEDELLELGRTGILLGFDAGWRYQQRALALQPGDFLLLYTDGVTEAFNAHGEEYGEGRLREVVLANRRAPAAALLAAVLDDLKAFAGDVPARDDVTLVVARRTA